MSSARRNSTGVVQERAEAVLSGATPKARIEAATAVAKEFASGTMAHREREIATRILGLLARDIEVRVRQAVAQHVKSCPYLPEDMAQTLANDVETVALPVIQYASVLSEADLMAISGSGSVNKQIAVAERQTVSENVSDALVDAETPELWARCSPTTALISPSDLTARYSTDSPAISRSRNSSSSARRYRWRRPNA